MRKKSDTRKMAANTGTEEIPPGATTQADHRKRNPGGGAPGSAAGPRHAADDEGSPVEEYGATDSNEPLADPTLEEDDRIDKDLPAYGGPSGGAVGGTPAEGRASGGNARHGFAPDRGREVDSTIGSDPNSRAG